MMTLSGQIPIVRTGTSGLSLIPSMADTQGKKHLYDDATICHNDGRKQIRKKKA
jgi:hypothetical protein